MMKAQIIAEQVKKNIKQKNLISLKKGTIRHVVPGSNSIKKYTSKISIKDLNRIIEIDTEKRLCIAEAGITFSEIVMTTLQYNLIPRCVPELKNITLGGAVSGFSLESMSYKYGGFHESCLEYQIVTGGGDIIICSRTENINIFHMLHCSFGTLGIITHVTFELIPAKPYVHMEYKKYDNVDEYYAAIYEHYHKQDIYFIDGIIHSPRDFVLCLGTFVDKVPHVSSYLNTVFYKSTLAFAEDYLSIYDYLFRYDHDCHWVTRKYGLENKLLRKLFGKIFLGSKNLISMAYRLSLFLNSRDKPDIITDVFIPFSNSKEFYRWYLENFNYFPIWVVPYRKGEKDYPWMNPTYMQNVDDTLYIDFAIYGFQQPKGSLNYYRILEEKVSELRGFKALISHNYYSEEEFWEVFNREEYMQIKGIVDPHSVFPDIYLKLHKK